VQNTAEEATRWIVCTTEKQEECKSYYRADKSFLQYPEGIDNRLLYLGKSHLQNIYAISRSWLSKVTEFVMNRRAEQFAEKEVLRIFCKHVLFLLWSLCKIMKGIELPQADELT